MNILESILLELFIGLLKDRPRVHQRRRRLEELILFLRAMADLVERRSGLAVRDESLRIWLRMLRGAALRGQRVLDAAGCDPGAVAGSARSFLAGLRRLFLCGAEVDQLEEAVEELERLAGPGGDVVTFAKILRLDNNDPGPTDMDLDVRPVAGAKRKRASTSASEGGSSSRGGGVGMAQQRHKRRRFLAWAHPRNWFPCGLAGFFASPREPAPAPTPRLAPAPVSRSHSARTVATAMARVRRRIGKPVRRRRRQTAVEQDFSRMTL